MAAPSIAPWAEIGAASGTGSTGAPVYALVAGSVVGAVPPTGPGVSIGARTAAVGSPWTALVAGSVDGGDPLTGPGVPPGFVLMPPAVPVDGSGGASFGISIGSTITLTSTWPLV